MGRMSHEPFRVNGESRHFLLLGAQRLAHEPLAAL